MKSNLQKEYECCLNWLAEYAAHPKRFKPERIAAMKRHVDDLRRRLFSA